METVHGEPGARCRGGVGPARARRPRRAKSEFWGRGSPLGGGRAEIHQHRHFGYIAAQFGAADDAMLVDQVLRVTTAAHGFREPHHRNPLDHAPLLDRGELDPEGAELVAFLLGYLAEVIVERSEERRVGKTCG